jgi:AcrR family transcriptional regulator
MKHVDDFRTRVLSKFSQEIFCSPDAGLQERRGAQTRELLLRATINCLNQVGYSRTTTDLIARTARSSRGAMIHHYPSKASLIASVIDYIFYKRLEYMLDGIHDVADNDPQRNAKLWALLLDNLHTPEYSAYVELSVAARTDAELKVVFVPRAKLYDEVWRDEMTSVNRSWDGRPELAQICIDIALAANEGLILNEAIWDEPERQERFKAVIRLVVTMLSENEIRVPTVNNARVPRKASSAAKRSSQRAERR